MQTKTLIQENDVAKSLSQRFDKEKDISAFVNNDSADQYYSELKRLKDQGFITSLALFAFDQINQYLSSKPGINSTEQALVDNAQTLYETMRTMSDKTVWTATKVLLATSKKTMFNDMVKATSDWMSDLSVNHSTPEAQKLMQSLYIFLRMTRRALEKDPSYAANIDRMTDVEKLKSNLDQLAATFKEKIDALSINEDQKSEDTEVASYPGMSIPDDDNTTETNSARLSPLQDLPENLDDLAKRYTNISLLKQQLNTQEGVNKLHQDLSYLSQGLNEEEHEKYVVPIWEEGSSMEALSEHMGGLIQLCQQRQEEQSQFLNSINELINQIALSQECNQKDLHDMTDYKVKIIEYFQKYPRSSIKDMDGFIAKQEQMEKQRNMKETLEEIKPPKEKIKKEETFIKRILKFTR